MQKIDQKVSQSLNYSLCVPGSFLLHMPQLLSWSLRTRCHFGEHFWGSQRPELYASDASSVVLCGELPLRSCHTFLLTFHGNQTSCRHSICSVNRRSLRSLPHPSNCMKSKTPLCIPLLPVPCDRAWRSLGVPKWDERDHQSHGRSQVLRHPDAWLGGVAFALCPLHRGAGQGV